MSKGFQGLPVPKSATALRQTKFSKMTRLTSVSCRSASLDAMSGRRLAALANLASCAASLPEWSKNATLRPAEALPSAHHHGEPGHVELPVTLLWSDRRQPVIPVAPFMLVVVALTIASLCTLMLALTAVRRALLIADDTAAGKPPAAAPGPHPGTATPAELGAAQCGTNIFINLLPTIKASAPVLHISPQPKELSSETEPLSPSLQPPDLETETQSHVVVISACPKPLRLPSSLA